MLSKEFLAAEHDRLSIDEARARWRAQQIKQKLRNNMEIRKCNSEVFAISEVESSGKSFAAVPTRSKRPMLFRSAQSDLSDMLQVSKMTIQTKDTLAAGKSESTTMDQLVPPDEGCIVYSWMEKLRRKNSLRRLLGQSTRWRRRWTVFALAAADPKCGGSSLFDVTLEFHETSESWLAGMPPRRQLVLHPKQIARREQGDEYNNRACFSVAVLGRDDRVVLATRSDEETGETVDIINRQLRENLRRDKELFTVVRDGCGF
jgi:hypothetical protein